MSSVLQQVAAPTPAVVPRAAFDAAVEYAVHLETQVDNAQSLMCKIIALHASGDMATLCTIIEQMGQRAATLVRSQRASCPVH